VVFILVALFKGEDWWSASKPTANLPVMAKALPPVSYAVTPRIMRILTTGAISLTITKHLNQNKRRINRLLLSLMLIKSLELMAGNRADVPGIL
jgi:hypothetical protein